MGARLIVDPKVADALGIPADQLATITLEQFKGVAYYKGLDVMVGGKDDGWLTVKMDTEQRPIITINK